jgi:threonylcarbamoyladenosine tRNA methylthiotransferase MtaB
LETLGCKVNQVESSYFLETLHEAGYTVVPPRESADVTIIHSCAVTSRAGFETRQLLRRARRRNPDGVVAVVGCNVHLEADRMASEKLATHILGNGEKFDLLRWLHEPGTADSPCMAVSAPREFSGFQEICVRKMAIGRTRAVLKVQDGCDAFCSYCIVPYTRGCSRSLPMKSVRRQLDRYMAEGFQEVVFSGIHLGQWGRDLAPGETLSTLLRQLKPGGLPHRVRLSSLEPHELTEELICELRQIPELCPHFHIPLQSGNDEILKAMNRPYGASLYRQLVQHLHEEFPDAALGADVLVGFPGETPSQFENTFSLLERLPLTYLHVFPFSARPGTRAFTLKDRIDGRTLRTRCGVLRELSARKRRAFAERFIGRDLEALVERRDPDGLLWQGTTRNYLKIAFPASAEIEPGSKVWVRLREVTPDGLRGEVVHRSCSCS